MLGRTDPGSPSGGWITDPVVVDTGEYVFPSHDLAWTVGQQLVASADRIYRHQTANQGGVTTDFGRYFHTTLRTVVDESGNALTATVQLGDGNDLAFERDTVNDPFVSPAGWEQFELDKVGNTQYELTYKDGYTYTFKTSGNPYKVEETRNRFGVGADYFYDAYGYVTKINRVAPGLSEDDSVLIDRDVANAITRIRDYAGRTVTYAYDESSNLTRVEDACGACSTIPTAEYEYDGSNRITVVKDADEETIRTIAYDGSNRVDYYVDAAGGTFGFAYGETDTVVDPIGHTIEYTFDGSGNLVTKNFTMESGGGDDITYVYEYDASRRVTKATMPNDSEVHLAYDGKGNVLTRFVKYDTTEVTKLVAAYDGDISEITTKADALGNTTSYTYSDGAPIQEVKPGSLTINYEYDGANLVERHVVATGGVKQYEYNSAGFVTKSIAYLVPNPDPEDPKLETTYGVDALGRRTSVVSPEGLTTLYAYNPAGKITAQTSPDGVVTEYEYDSNGRQTARKIMDGETPEFTWTMSYDTAGRMTATVDPASGTTTYAYDLAGRRTKQTAPGDDVTEWVYDKLGRVLTTKRGDSEGTRVVATFVYDKMGNVVTQADGESNETVHAYDVFGRRTKTTDPTGAYTLYEYDDADRVTVEKRCTGSVESPTIHTHRKYAYDANGRQTSARHMASPGGEEGTSDALTTMLYDAEDRLTQRVAAIDASNSLTTTHVFDGAGRMTAVIDPDTLTTAYAYDGDGRRTAVVDPLDNTTEYEYDDDGHLTKVTNPLGHYTETAYDPFRGLQTQVSQYNSGDALLARTKYEYDSVGRQTLARRKASPGGADSDTTDHVEKSFFDAAGRLTKRTGASGNDTLYAYDDYGQQTQVTFPGGDYTTSGYDDAGRLTSQTRYEIVGAVTRSFRTDHELDVLGRITKTINQGPDGTFGNGDDLTRLYVYDAVGRQITTTNERGRHTVSAYDALGRKTRVTEDSAGVARITDSAFDRSGRLTALVAYNDGTSGAQTTEYAYNGRGLQTEVTYEVTGTVTHEYDDAGNMTLRTDEAEVAVEYQYDAANRLTYRGVPEQEADSEYYAYDGLGRLVTAQKSDGSYSDGVSRSVFSYDALSRVTKENQAIRRGTAKDTNYTYDKAGNRVTLTHDGWSITAAYEYDGRDRCTKIKKNGSDLAEYSWLGNAISKRVTTLDYPGGTKPAFKSDFQRDGVGRVTRLVNEHLTADMAGSTYGDLGTWDYDYDAGENLLTAVQDTTLGVYLRQDTEHTYDTADRLLTTEYTDFQQWGPTNISSTSWYSYDDLGNRISHKYRADSAIGYEHDAANRMTKIDTLTQGYDLAGNVTLAYSADRGTSYKYHYDHHNRLTAVYDGATDTTRKAAFAWDALGRRVEYANDVLDTVTEYWYDGVNEIGEKTTHDPGGTPYYSTRHYIHGVSYVDERLMMHTITRPYYYVVDRMYNVRAILDRAGAIVERYAYDSYGRPLIRESCGRGDMNQDTKMSSTDTTRFNAAKASSIWDPRADMDDDGDVDSNDETLYTAKYSDWSGSFPDAEPRQAFSDVGNSFMFQGVPHFAMDTEDDALIDVLSLNHHRARLVDCPTARWTTRDPREYSPRLRVPQLTSYHQTLLQADNGVNSYSFLRECPVCHSDPMGLAAAGCVTGMSTGCLFDPSQQYGRTWFEVGISCPPHAPIWVQKVEIHSFKIDCQSNTPVGFDEKFFEVADLTGATGWTDSIGDYLGPRFKYKGFIRTHMRSWCLSQSEFDSVFPNSADGSCPPGHDCGNAQVYEHTQDRVNQLSQFPSGVRLNHTSFDMCSQCPYLRLNASISGCGTENMSTSHSCGH